MRIAPCWGKYHDGSARPGETSGGRVVLHRVGIDDTFVAVAVGLKVERDPRHHHHREAYGDTCVCQARYNIENRKIRTRAQV
jgi:hypothetical protein